MSVYPIALFLHVVGAILLFVILGIEGVALLQLRRARTTEETRISTSVTRITRVLGPISGAAILVPGLYMMATSWGWKPWIGLGLFGWVLIAGLGALNGFRLLALERTPRTEVRDPLLAASWNLRAGIALGILFLMTVKPDAPLAVLAIVLGAGLGLAVTVPGLSRPGFRETTDS